MAQHDRERSARNDDPATTGRLVHTRDLDQFDFPKDSPDPRGWDVRSADGTKIGKVEDLIVDTGQRRVRYIEVAFDRSLAKDTDRDYALVPIGEARIDDAGDNVIVDLARRRDVAALVARAAADECRVAGSIERQLDCRL